MSDTVANKPAAELERLLAEGFEHHCRGRFAEAEANYKRVLTAVPDRPDAMSLMGMLALQTKRLPEALELLGKCVRIAPDNFATHNNFGEALRNAGRIAEAIESYGRSIALNPNHPDAYSNLALATAQLGRYSESADALERAVQLLPNRADLHDRLGATYLRLGDPASAAASFRRAVATEPNFAQAHGNLATAITKLRPFADAPQALVDEAHAAAQRAIALAPGAAEAHASLASVYAWMNRSDDAIRVFERCAELQPTIADFYGMRAQLLTKLNRDTDAVNVLSDGVRYCPPDARLRSALSGAHRRSRDYASAVREADIAVKLAPNFSEAHGNLALALLSAGEYERGFTEYEWRWRCDTFTTAPRDFQRPMWNGTSTLSGRTILVHTEQGYGDTIQFARFVPKLADAGATVILECHHSLAKLMSRVRGVSRVIAAGITLPDFDLHIPMLSLPSAFGTTIDSVPRDVPYLSAAPDRAAEWKRRISDLPSRAAIKVGLIWAGNVEPDPLRNVPGEILTALGGIPNVQLFSLQRIDASTYTAPPPSLNLIDLAPQLFDFQETAAAMQALDLIITIDTSAAHLAGALARPTWTMVPWSCDWRWLPEREQSVWYPTMRLFRQKSRGDWNEVIERVRNELMNL